MFCFNKLTAAFLIVMTASSFSFADDCLSEYVNETSNYKARYYSWAERKLNVGLKMGRGEITKTEAKGRSVYMIEKEDENGNVVSFEEYQNGVLNRYRYITKIDGKTFYNSYINGKCYKELIKDK